MEPELNGQERRGSAASAPASGPLSSPAEAGHPRRISAVQLSPDGCAAVDADGIRPDLSGRETKLWKSLRRSSTLYSPEAGSRGRTPTEA